VPAFSEAGDILAVVVSVTAVPTVIPQLVANSGMRGLSQAIAEPGRWVLEPKVDGVRGLIAYLPDGTVETRNRRGERRDWLRAPAFADGLRRLADRLPILWQGTVLDGELTAGEFRTTMAALYGSRNHGDRLRLVVFDLPILAGVDLRGEPWRERRARLEMLATAFEIPLELSPLVEPSVELATDIVEGRIEGVVVKDRESPYRDGSRAGWFKVKDPSWYEREAWRFDRR
jgi:bifunctional non-homologous end joining protein LigD